MHFFPTVLTEGRIMMDHVKHESVRSAESERVSSGGGDKTRIPSYNLHSCKAQCVVQRIIIWSSLLCLPSGRITTGVLWPTSVCSPHLCEHIRMLQIYEIIFASFSSYQIL